MTNGKDVFAGSDTGDWMLDARCRSAAGVVISVLIWRDIGYWILGSAGVVVNRRPQTEA
jgi:hypothetical protein